MLGRVLAIALSIAGVTGILTAAQTATGNHPAADALLVQGSPPLTSGMVDRRIAVWESFLQVRFTDGQKAQLRNAMIGVWRKHDKDEMQHALDDLKYYDHQEQLDAVRAANLDSFVENLRAHPEDAESAILLQAFEGAHPDRKDVMHSHGYGDLVGTWTRGDAMPSQRNPFTGRLEGISFSESSALKIFSDGRFQHAWLHRHCPDGDRCCRESVAMMQGVISVERQTLVLSGASGNLAYKDPCAPNASIEKSLGPERQDVGWSLKRNPASKTLVLCLDKEPFQFPGQAKQGAVCYNEQP